MEEHPQDRNRFPRVWFLAAVATLAFAFQGSRGLWEPDEGRYVNTALQMIKTGEWTVPYRHHETQHLTKPPLTYWALAGSMTVFGRNEWAIRLPNALAFFLTVIAVWVMGRQFLPARPWLPALVYTSSALPFASSSGCS